MMKIVLLVFLILVVAGCAKPKITNFEECAAAGYPVMESYPRQCAANGQTFTEEAGVPAELTQDEAIAIAQNSECVDNATLTDNVMYNDYTRTWWIDLDLEKEGCSPACVVSEDTETAEINWRCTGLIVE